MRCVRAGGMVPDRGMVTYLIVIFIVLISALMVAVII